MKNEKICLIGSGWLGKPLAIQLLAAKYLVTATSRSGLESTLKLDLELKGVVPNDIVDSDVLIYTIPPLDLEFVKTFFDQIPQNKKILFTSSTSVYGKNVGLVDENFKLNINNTNSPLLIETENYLINRFENLTIIRPGGLYGLKRHPVFFLQGKTGLTSGNEYLHLVHQTDCINAIQSILSKNTWGEIFNLVSNEKILKKDYYSNMALKLNLTPPTFIEGVLNLAQTQISNKKSKLILKIDYLDPNLYR
jgi:hypothetical protein